jgi:glutathione S-transferase
MAGKLYIGTRRYSSWSLRGWLMVRLAGLLVEDVVIPLQAAGTPGLRALSPNALVPYLEHEGAAIWESLAIAEYCAELAPALWPAERIARAHARAIAAEMHAGFGALRRAMPMNLGRHVPGYGQTPESLADISRIEDIIATSRAAYGAGGPYLFGAAFTAADAMFAPVMTRFLSYEPPLKAATRHYVDAVRAHQLVAAWYDLAAAEPATWRLDKYENLT